MNKKEQKLFDDTVEALKLRIALCWTEEVKPDVSPPERGGLSKGWLYAGSLSWGMRVEPSCSSAAFHSMGSTAKTSTQGSCRLYSTKLLALKAARNSLEQEAARQLRRLDQQIEDETINPTPLP